MKNCYGACYDPIQYQCQNQQLVQNDQEIPQIPDMSTIPEIPIIPVVSNTPETPVTSKISAIPTSPVTLENSLPKIDSSIPKKEGKMIIQLNNNSGGAWGDDEIYWIIIGRNENHEISYLDLDGNLVKADASLNDATTPIGNRRYASSIIHKLSDRNFVYLPAVESGRMYISYGEPVYITFNDGGYAGPDINNETDPNGKTLFEYFEFTTEYINGAIVFHGNTTRVDFFSIPYVIRLINSSGDYDRCEGDFGSRDDIFNAYINSVSEPFKTLVDNLRIIAPCKTSFREGNKYADYFDDSIEIFWNKYSQQELKFQIQGNNFIGHVEGNKMIFTKSGSNGIYIVDRPTTQDVLEGRGALNRASSNNPEQTSVELAIEAQLCAAFNRGVATEPENWNNVLSYYKTNIHNEYASFFHKHSVSGKAYGFCYDDVNDQSTLLECGNADTLIIDLRW
ncbi:hypothetical protein BCR36DRAFT_583707 [Piromyces finnis]|uniref:GH64 domain-containing protein n=1 Tax=Piromyces finnis TaxID=1754191 RepID=A0A1Y1V979_9FUNG|nr:hypothetical protein BCR36DRAFT_583707 [Piromyces finnis]|eukprot:ORX49636.1 hypothetical protein BCR36DRAFT_583707 [Piromyces finnis]